MGERRASSDNMILFKERVALAKEFREWAEENNVRDCAESVIAYLQDKGYLDEFKIKMDRKAKELGTYRLDETPWERYSVISEYTVEDIYKAIRSGILEFEKERYRSPSKVVLDTQAYKLISANTCISMAQTGTCTIFGVNVEVKDLGDGIIAEIIA